MFNLHLKKVEIQGFKSFGDKAEIEFKEGITAIVGPNGSGKSNISDAIRWVLGEQSVKTLRGSKMEDIIFSGTSIRKPLGYAEVTITFDNKDCLIPVDYQEVAITRRMFRSGESEYYLNKSSCRLRDIKEIFMDTGVGKDGYSIIGQGRVDEILSSRPEDRRNIFEEAAGIVKFKSKKSEAEKKLEKTESNLIRIKDIISELEKQYDNLKEQSEKASTFIGLSSRLKELEVNLFVRNIDEIKAEIENCKREKSKIQVQLNEVVAKRNKIEDNLNSMKIKTEEMNLYLDNIQKEKIETSNQFNQCKNDLSLLEEKEKFYIKDIERLEREIVDLKKRLEELEKDRISTIDEINNMKKEKLSLREDYNRKNINLEELNEKILLKEKAIEKDKDKVINLYNLITDKKSNINSLNSFEDNIHKRIEQLKREIQILSDGKNTAKESLMKIEELELKKREEVIIYNKFLTNLRLEEKTYKEQLDRLYKEINTNKMELQGRISNFNLLKNMQDDYEGYYKSVKNLMLACKREEKLKNSLIGVVADLIKVEEIYEKAIDVGLGGSLQNVVTGDEEDAKFIIDYLRKNKLGRVTFLPLSTIKGNPIYISQGDREKYKILGLGSELISYDVKYKNIMEYLLGRTIVVKDLNDATIVAKKYNYSFRIVTLDGDIINAGGSMTGGSLPKVSGNILNRRYRIETLKNEINNLSKTQNNLEEDKSKLKSILENNLVELKEKEEILQNLNIEIIKIESEKNKYSMELKRIDESIIKYDGEIHKLNQELDGINIEKEKFSKELKDIEEESNLIKDNINDFVSQFEEEKLIREEAMRDVTDTKIQMNFLENKLGNANEKLEITKMEIDSTRILIEEKNQECIKYKKEIENITDLMTSTRETIDKLSILGEEKDRIFKQMKKEKDEFMDGYYLEQNRLKDMNDKLNNLEKSKNGWDIKEAKYSVKLENINAKLLEDYELEYDEAVKLLIEIEDIDTAYEEVKRLKNRIKELGTVNLGSIEEYKTTSERLGFITKQHEDLLLAKENLQEVIVDMEVKMKEQFLFNFNKINENFNQVFSVLFDGGKADLVLEDEENILECGIEIKAQPPGKKLQNLTLLSGGEKSLTAVALLFAILQIKPTPFCILDEIDAALDEANISRYTSYLRGFSDETQFIMITHRKSTMEMADVLYGVTMEEEGISKIVSVKLTDNLDEIAS